ncbi:MAG: RHS repeat domain-containing protein, partial [bacterium]
TLDQIALAVGGTRDYTYGPAGHLEEVAAGANVIELNNNEAGRLTTAARTAAGVSVSLLYDARSFLSRAVESADDPPTEAASVEAVYDSDGLLHSLRRKASPSDPEESVVHFYLAGRPVAQLAVDDDGVEAWSYLTTDHLGTPLLTTDQSGVLMWEGGLEPFGRDFQEATPSGALANGLHLRLPGQWVDTSWQSSMSGASLSYNARRWLEASTGRYSKPDPIGLTGGISYYGYVFNNPLRYIDPLGLQANFAQPGPDFQSGPWGRRPDEECCDEEQVDRRSRRLEEILRQFHDAIPGKPSGELGGAVVTPCIPIGIVGQGELGPCRPPGPGPNEPFNPYIPEDLHDPCLVFCARAHEWFHWTDTRARNENWHSYTLFRYIEEPGHRLERECLATFF